MHVEDSSGDNFNYGLFDLGVDTYMLPAASPRAEMDMVLDGG